MNGKSGNSANVEESKSEEQNSGNVQENKNKVDISERRIDEWMVRPCDIYSEEYSDCTSLKGRFHQYFIYGENIDCTQWKRDFENCKKWVQKKDETAYQELLASETSRRLARFKAHYENNIWKKRSKPPENWNEPLPDWMQEKFKNSYLDIRSRELKTGEITHDSEGVCNIL